MYALNNSLSLTSIKLTHLNAYFPLLVEVSYHNFSVKRKLLKCTSSLHDLVYHDPAPLVWKLEIFSQRCAQNTYPTSKAVGERRIIWLVRRWLIAVFWKQRYLLFFCIISPSRVINLWNGYDTIDVPLPLRLSWIRYLALFWDLKIYSMLESDILCYDLRE